MTEKQPSHHPDISSIKRASVPHAGPLSQAMGKGSRIADSILAQAR
jgi:hypothetical protein